MIIFSSFVCLLMVRSKKLVELFSFADALIGIAQKIIVKKLLTFKPSIVMVQSAVSRTAQQLFLEAGVVLLTNVKDKVSISFHLEDQIFVFNLSTNAGFFSFFAAERAQKNYNCSTKLFFLGI
jgi:hypothetical protein